MAGFVDEAQLHVKAGDGGAGSVSFRREAHVSRGGPDGGDGGKGGDVWLVASPGLASLHGFKDHPHRRARDGVHGSGKQKRGANGEDLEVKVPVGTTVHGLDGSAVADLGSPGARALVARGGRGGRGNARFLSNRRRAPAFAEQAEIGEELWLNLELRLVADVALVGFPNVGKSTFISAVSAARPKIADYPFTTLEPHLGVVVTGRTGDETEFVVADIPGLVEGAAEGKGLGHRFLRHIERARVLLVLVDLSPGSPPAEEQQHILLDELRRYRAELLDRPRIVCGSKADVAAPEVLDAMHDMPAVSAVTGSGVGELIAKLAALVTAARAAEIGLDSSVGRPPADANQDDGGADVFVHRPLGESAVQITRGPDGTFLVGGRQALRAVALSDLTDDDALDLVQARLKRLGVEKALVRAGVRDGDQVQVGDLAFTYHPDDLRPGEPEAPDRKTKRARRAESSRSGRSVPGT
ncbi:MAG: GTPase ObgE [Acidimicrobiales bacterium]